MIGINQLLNLRFSGMTPGNVWIHLLDHKADFYQTRDAEDAIANGFCVTLLINPDERISGLDFVAVSGTTVHIIGNHQARCDAVFGLCEPIAERVLATINGILRDSKHEQLVASE